MYISCISLSLLLFSSYTYGVHAHTIRYNNSCLETERRGNPDNIDLIIFKHKPIISYNHVTATPTSTVEARKDIVAEWRTYVLKVIEVRLNDIIQENNTKTTNSYASLTQAAIHRLQEQHTYLKTIVYQDLDEHLIAVPEQDIMLFVQWAEKIDIQGDDIMPLVEVTLNKDVVLSLGTCCGDLAYVVKDHMYWQKVIEAGWVAVDSDPEGRIQPILHTSMIGDKFHFYKTKFGVYFRETLAADAAAPGDLLRIVKYLDIDPRYDRSLYGDHDIIWIKFPSDPAFDASSKGQYISGENSTTASWLYVQDLGTLYTELQ